MKGSKGLCIYLKAEEIPGNCQLGDSVMKDVRSVIASNGFSCLQMRSLGSHSPPGREKEGKKGRGSQPAGVSNSFH